MVAASRNKGGHFPPNSDIGAWHPPINGEMQVKELEESGKNHPDYQNQCNHQSLSSAMIRHLHLDIISEQVASPIIRDRIWSGLSNITCRLRLSNITCRLGLSNINCRLCSVICSRQAHHSFPKGAGLEGVGSDNLFHLFLDGLMEGIQWQSLSQYIYLVPPPTSALQRHDKSVHPQHVKGQWEDCCTITTSMWVWGKDQLFHRLSPGCKMCQSFEASW